MIGFIVIVAIFAVAALTYWLTTLKPNDRSRNLKHEWECMSHYLLERYSREEGLFLCRIAREEMFSEEFKTDLEKRLIQLKQTDPDLWIPSNSFNHVQDMVAETAFERVKEGDPFWDYDDYDNRLKFIERVIQRIEDND